MRRYILAILLAALGLTVVSRAYAQTPAGGGCSPPPGTANEIVCLGNTPCPPGYYDPVGPYLRNATGTSQTRWLCQWPGGQAAMGGSSSGANPPTSAAPQTASLAPPNAAAQQASISPPAPLTTVIVAHLDAVGSFLVDPYGMTLYVRNLDSIGASTCTGSCALVFPPFQPPAVSLTLPSGATGTLALLTRDDGTQQVTYNGMPLYHYTGDLKSGDVTGQGLPDIWQLVTP